MELRWHTVETNWSRAVCHDNVRRSYRLQDSLRCSARWSGSRQHVVTHHRGGREVQLIRGGIRENEAFSGHEMKGSAGTGRGSVLMAGGRQGQGTGKGKR